MSEGGLTKKEVWNNWVEQYISADSLTPLFETDENLIVQTKTHGRDNRPILQRSEPMEELLRNEVLKVVEDWNGTDDTYEGVIYLMYTLDGEEIVPRYIGKAGKYGRDGKRLSTNLKNVQTNSNKFARWGDGYDYHIGELSAAVLKHHEDESVNLKDEPKAKYQQWADELFTDGCKLREPVYFWMRAWRKDDTGPFYDFETSLESLEYNLINLASDLYPEKLLNSEGA